MRRRGGGRVVVLVVAALSAVAVAAPAGAQEGEPGAEIFTDEASDSDSMATDLGFVVQATGEGFGSYTVFVSSGGRRRDIASGASLDQIGERVDPCDYRSDLPGTSFTVTVEKNTVVATQVLTLGPDTTKPKFLDPTSSPRPGSQVEAGDRIRFEVTATDKNTRNTSWQTGVRTLQVTGPRGLIDDDAAGRLPKPCDQKSKSLTVKDSYRVRRSDPAVIELCAIAEDYVPNENTTCLKYYKGEVWEGTISGGFQFPGCTPGTLSGDVILEVVDDALTGTMRATSSPHDCGGVAIGELPVGLDIVGGTKTDDRFEIEFGASTSAELEIDGGRASGAVVYAGPNPEFVFLGNAGSEQEIMLECVSCDDEAVG